MKRKVRARARVKSNNNSLLDDSTEQFARDEMQSNNSPDNVRQENDESQF